MVENNTPSQVVRLSHRIIVPLLTAFWGYKVTGLEHVPQAGPLIVASNHFSWFDGPAMVLSVGVSRYMRFLTKIEAFSIPILGWYLKSVGMIPLDRGRGDVGSLRAAIDLVRGGACLGVFPEGTRSRTGATGRAKPGVGFLARETGAPVVPARLVNTEQFWRLRPVEVRFGPALMFEGGRDGGREQCQAFAEAVMSRIMAL